MSKSARKPRTIPELLLALDHHQFLLRTALHGLRTDRAFIKTLATELRTLICFSSGTEGLLWRLTDALKVSDEIDLHVGESVNRDHPLNAGLIIWQLPMHRTEDGPPGQHADRYSLREVIKKCEAIYVAQPKDRIFTHELLIGAIAGQMGGAHEAEGLDDTLVKLNSFLINQTELFVPVLALDAELTLQIGERVLDHAEATTNFQRAQRASGNGDVSVCVRVLRAHQLLGVTPVVSLRSPVSEVEVRFDSGVSSGRFIMTKRGRLVMDLSSQNPNVWPDNTEAMFTFCYSSSHRMVRTITNEQPNGAAVTCDIGWLDAAELRPELLTPQNGLVALTCLRVYHRLLRPAECGELLGFSPDMRELRRQGPPSGPFPD